MITRNKVISQAVNDCMKELYSLVQPSIEWDEFKKECEIYSKSHKEWEEYHFAFELRNENPENWEKYKKLYENLDWEGKSITECIGPKPYDFYYIPKEIMKEICDSYIYAYRLDQQQELLDTIEILKNYCRVPIVEKYIEGENGNPGYRGYEHLDNLEKEIQKYLKENFAFISDESLEEINLHSNGLQNKFFEFLDKAGKFFNWNRDVSTFNINVYLGASPCSNKQTVIDNWKIYRNRDIEIDESKYKDDDDYI